MTAKPCPSPPRRSRAFAAARRRLLEIVAAAPDGAGLAAACSRRLGRPVRVLGVDPLDGAPDPGSVCLHVREGSGAEHAIRISRSLALELASQAFDVGAWTLPAGRPPEPVVEGIAVQVLRVLDEIGRDGPAIELADLHPACAPRPTAPGRVALSVRISVGPAVGCVEVDLEAPREPPTPRANAAESLGGLPIPLAAVAARGRVPAADLRALAPGDAVAFDETAPAGSAWLEPDAPGWSGRRWRLSWSADGAIVDGFESVVPGGTGRRPMSGPDAGSDRTEVIETASGALAGLDELPVEVTAVAGRTTMPLRDLAALGPGAVVALGRAPGGVVDLTANGAPFARGRFVDLDGELAVEVTELRATPATPGRRTG